MSGTGFAEPQDCSGIFCFRVGRILHNRWEIHALKQAMTRHQTSTEVDGMITACIVAKLLTSVTSPELSQTEQERACDANSSTAAYCPLRYSCLQRHTHPAWFLVKSFRVLLRICKSPLLALYTLRVQTGSLVCACTNACERDRH